MGGDGVGVGEVSYRECLCSVSGCVLCVYQGVTFKVESSRYHHLIDIFMTQSEIHLC